MSLPYSPYIIKGNVLFISGQLGVNQNNELVSEDVKEQFLAALKNLENILSKTGFNKEDIVKTTIFITNEEYFPIVNEEFSKFFDKVKPTRTTIIVKALPKGAKVEIEAIAMKWSVLRVKYLMRDRINKAHTLIEVLIVLSLMSLLLLVMIQIMLSISRYNKKVGYIQEADLKAKEIGIKIEKILYNKGFLFIQSNNNILSIYNIQDGQKLTYVEFYYNQSKIQNSYYRRINVYYNGVNRNTVYLPENVFWKIEDNFNILGLRQNFTRTYLYNFRDNNNPILIEPPDDHVEKTIYNIVFQSLSIGFYVYSSDHRGRKFSSYIKEYLANPGSYPHKPIGMLVYFINIINIPTSSQ